MHKARRARFGKPAYRLPRVWDLLADQSYMATPPRRLGESQVRAGG